VYNLSLSSAARDAGIPEARIRKRAARRSLVAQAEEPEEAAAVPETPESPDLKMVRQRDALRVFVARHYGAYGKLPDRERLIGAGYFEALESYQGSVETVARDAGIDIFADRPYAPAAPASPPPRRQLSPEETLEFRKWQMGREQLLYPEPRRTTETQAYSPTGRYAIGQRIRHDIGSDGVRRRGAGYGEGVVKEHKGENTMLVEFEDGGMRLMAWGYSSSLGPRGNDLRQFRKRIKP
jgi:hypothetical protein